jgi:curli biogenesis system outer membrane secretion channel CsgG
MLTLIMLIPVGTIWAADSGFKQRVAILEFEDKTDHGYWSAGKGIADILTTRLLKTGKYEIVERQRLDDVLAEQGLRDILDPATAIKPKQIKGIEVLIYGSVTLFNVKDTSVGIGRFRVGKSDADVEVQLRVVDATTGSILLADSSKARDSSPREVHGAVDLPSGIRLCIS